MSKMNVGILEVIQILEEKINIFNRRNPFGIEFYVTKALKVNGISKLPPEAIFIQNSSSHIISESTKKWDGPAAAVLHVGSRRKPGFPFRTRH